MAKILPLSEPQQRTMADAARVALQEAIVSGELEPGSPLPLEALAARLGMSISPVREAIRELETLGIATHQPHRGAYVTKLTLEGLHDTYEARLALEPLATRRAAERFTEDDAAAARKHLTSYEAARRAGVDRTEREAHEAFHFGIYTASESPWLTRLIRPLWEGAERYRILSTRADGRVRVKQIKLEHEAILAACVARDPDAAEAAMHAHLARNANQVAKVLGSAGLY